MSQENVEYIRQTWVTFGETGEPDFSSLDPEVEIHDHDLPDAPVHHGHAGFVRWMGDWAAAWAEYSVEPEEFIGAGDRVVVVVRMTATGRGSGVTLERHDALVYDLRDRKVVRIDYFNNREQALEAVGLSG